jgi:hypothetical protein
VHKNARIYTKIYPDSKRRFFKTKLGTLTTLDIITSYDNYNHTILEMDIMNFNSKKVQQQ